jgi:hypothetical protein
MQTRPKTRRRRAGGMLQYLHAEWCVLTVRFRRYPLRTGAHACNCNGLALRTNNVVKGAAYAAVAGIVTGGEPI